MPGERLKSPRLRLFVALDLPADVRETVDGWRREAFGKRDEIRFPADATLHATLAFLGYRPEKDLERIRAAALEGEAPAAGPVPLRIEGLRALPPRRPRLHALSLADLDGRLERIQAELSDRLAAERLYEPEQRPFWAHVTVARTKRGRDREAAKAPLPDLPEAMQEPFFGVRLALYRSEIKRSGAEYIPLSWRDLDRG